MGYKGIKLREIEYKKSLSPCDIEIFIFENCIFSPGSTVLKTSLTNEFLDWKKKLGKAITNEEDKEIKDYFHGSEHVLYSTVWTFEGSGQGYYGLSLKSDCKDYKKPSTTSKKVYKLDTKTKEIINTWDTIAKAAETEQISSAKMSRIIKNQTLINSNYLYTIQV